MSRLAYPSDAAIRMGRERGNVAQACAYVDVYRGHNYIGHNYIGDNYIGHNYIPVEVGLREIARSGS